LHAPILQRTVRGLESCVSVDRNSPELKSAQKLLSTARQILARRAPQASGSASIDNYVSLAEQLRDVCKTLCSLGGGQDFDREFTRCDDDVFRARRI
jgi:hypothetical protein